MEVAGKRLDDDIVSELCEPCQEGHVTTQADGYCYDCEEYMCQTCFQSHVKMRLGRNHVLGAVDAGRNQGTQSSSEKCKKHTTEFIKYYCRNHDSVGCGHCIVFDHRKCEPELIKDLSKNLTESSDFKNILKELDELESLKDKIEVSLEKNRNDNAEYHDKAVQGIQNHRAEINTWLENITSKIEAEEIKIWKENETLHSKLEDWIKEINDMIDKVRDEINNEKFTGENLFIHMIECKSEINEFATKSVPEIKSSLEINYFSFEPNQNLCVFTSSANLGMIRVGSRNEELQTNHEEQHNDLSFIDGTRNKASFNMTGIEAKYAEAAVGDAVKSSEVPLRAELEKELENIRQTTALEKEQTERLQQSYNTLKKEFDDQMSLLSKEKEERVKSNIERKEFEKTIVLLKQEVSSLNGLNISQKSQLEGLQKKYETLESQSTARQQDDQSKIISLQSEVKKISENHEVECKSLLCQISDLQHQKKTAEETYTLPDPRAVGFDVNRVVTHIHARDEVGCYKRIDRIGTVTAIDQSGFVDVEWNRGGSGRYPAGAGGQYWVILR